MKLKVENRYFVVIASTAIQLCLGIAYIWSVFQTGIAEQLFSGDHAKASLSFSLLLAMLSVGGIFSGLLKKIIPTRAIVIAGGVIISLGFILSSLVSPKTSWALWITYGLLGGVGMGLTYSTTIAVSQKWFPDKRGLITGIIVSALGLGGVVFTPLVELMIKTFENGQPANGELKTFFILGFLFLIVCTIGGLFIVEPPSNYLPKDYIEKEKNSTKNFSPLQMFKTYQFYLITISFALACMGGLMMIGFAKPIAVAKGMGKEAAVGVIIIALFNSIGRLFWGWISDKIGQKWTLSILLVITAIASLFLNLASGYFIFILIGLIGFAYGGFLSNFAALTSEYFGQLHAAFNYGFVLIGFGIGAVSSSFIAGHFKNLAANDISKMFPAFIISASAAILAFILILFLKKTNQNGEITNQNNKTEESE